MEILWQWFKESPFFKPNDAPHRLQDSDGARRILDNRDRVVAVLEEEEYTKVCAPPARGPGAATEFKSIGSSPRIAFLETRLLKALASGRKTRRELCMAAEVGSMDARMDDAILRLRRVGKIVRLERSKHHPQGFLYELTQEAGA